MSQSVMVHGVCSVRAGTVSHSNFNAISLEVSCKDTNITITLFDLPTASANHLEKCLGYGAKFLNEEEIRNDERRKIADRIGVTFQ